MGGFPVVRGRSTLADSTDDFLALRRLRSRPGEGRVGRPVECVRIVVSCAIVFFFPHLLAAQPFPDSLELWGLQLRIADADARVRATDFLHRLIPRITLAASFGFRDLLFVDPADRTPYFVPSDLYRLTASLSLTDLLSGREHEGALLEREQRKIELEKARMRQAMDSRSRREHERAIKAELALLDDQIRLLSGILRYQKILFDQGTIHYDVYARAELQVVQARQERLRLDSRLREMSGSP